MFESCSREVDRPCFFVEPSFSGFILSNVVYLVSGPLLLEWLACVGSALSGLGSLAGLAQVLVGAALCALDANPE